MNSYNISNNLDNSSDKMNNSVNENNQQNIWDKALEKFKFLNGQSAFNSWLKPLKFEQIDGGVLHLKSPTRFIRDWFNTNYSDAILKIIREDSTKVFAINVTVDANVQGQKSTLTEEQVKVALNSNVVKISHPENNIVVPTKTNDFESPVDARYVFENFVVDASNKFAYSAAKSVITSEEVLIENNPLYIHGSVGLGKTHLLHAIAHKLKQVKPNKKVAYISAEKFMFQFVKAIRENNIVAFKEYFRKVDVLLVDDIQFICGKNTTQEEFIHTFNALIENGKQVVLAGDRHPNDLTGLDERMKSRLNWGLVADVKNSTFELRVGILHAKSKRLGVALPQNVAEFLAEKITSNIRELEGALNKIISKSRLEEQQITMEFTIDALHDLLKNCTREVTIEEIKQKVAEHCCIRLTDLVSAKRNREFARPRQIAMYLAKKYTTKSLPEIGKNFGGKDHTTVLHAVRQIDKLKETDSFVRDNLGELSKIIER
jgi:chromosomal replication initiator protein